MPLLSELEDTQHESYRGKLLDTQRIFYTGTLTHFFSLLSRLTLEPP